MKVESIGYYSLKRSQDEEGRYYKEMYRTYSKAIAEHWTKMSRCNSFDKFDELVVWIEAEVDFPTAEIETKRKKALSKLTAEERKLLGLV